NYERYFTDEDGNNYWHILDPKDGYPADNGLVSVTIIGESGIMCDALSTALFVMGTEDAIKFWKETGSFDMILVTENSKLYYTKGLDDCFQNVSNMEMEIISNE
ncbi:MAG: FAD:protein FMN transferase, partial [Hominimerdicola sp.]